MNSHRRRPLKLHLRAAPTQKVLYRSSTKLPLKVVLAGIFLAVIIVGALSFAAFSVLKNARLKHQGHATVASSAATASPLLAGSVNPVATTVASPRVALVSATPSLSPSATPVLRPTALAKATPVVIATAVANDRAPREVKTPSKNARKTAEQKRREAERKRARLEAQYRNHEISEAAYNQGQLEYQNELARYRDVVSAGKDQ
jgi:hypothetical protein